MRLLVGVLGSVIFVACGSEPSTLTVSASVPISTTNGTAASYLAKYVGQTISFEVAFDDYGVARDESVGCGETTVHTALATRTATGPTGADFQREILDPVAGWELSLEVCDNQASSSVLLVGAIDEINTSFGCTGVPSALQHRDASGHPTISSFVATGCNAIVLDVPVAFSVGAPDFEMSIRTESSIP